MLPHVCIALNKKLKINQWQINSFMDNDFDLLRNKWKNLECSRSDTPQQNMALIDSVRSQRSHNITKKIERTYRCSMLGGLLLPILSFTLLDSFDASLFLRITYGAFGLLMAILCFFMVKRLRNCNYTLMSMREAIIAINRLLNYHSILLIVGCLFALPLLIFLYYEIDKANDIYLTLGFFVGLIVGLP
jgi:hypothetical protein